MRRGCSIVILMLLALGSHAQAVPEAVELTRLLKEFLDGASRNDASVHDRFWAEDLVYTGSSGRRIGKADIMSDLRAAPPPKPGGTTTTYAAEDIRIQQYGDSAVVAFRLVGTVKREGKSEALNYLNTGTFVRRDGKWQVVSWQATRIPREEESSRNQVAATEAGFHQAMITSDVKAFERLADKSFIWTQRTGQQITRQQLLDQMKSAQLKYSKPETMNVKISVYGDAAVVRGTSPRQGSSTPGAGGDASPLNVYTLTFVSEGGIWRAVAMHTSSP